jgi:zinc and cadmium transporter
MTWGLAIASTVAVSLVSLIGALALSVGEARLRRITAWLVSFAIGCLLGDAFLHLVPESLARTRSALGTCALTLAGVVAFFVLDRILHRRRRAPRRVPQLAAVNLVADGFHNFVDGVLIGASWLASPVLGVSTTLAVALHELPQELADFGVLVHSGVGVRRALALNLASASVAIAGTAAALVAGELLGEGVAAVLVPLTAGGFVYIAAADLVPALDPEPLPRELASQVALVVLGVGAMAALLLVE